MQQNILTKDQKVKEIIPFTTHQSEYPGISLPKEAKDSENS